METACQIFEYRSFKCKDMPDGDYFAFFVHFVLINTRLCSFGILNTIKVDIADEDEVTHCLEEDFIHKFDVNPIIVRYFLKIDESEYPGGKETNNHGKNRRIQD